MTLSPTALFSQGNGHTTSQRSALELSEEHPLPVPAGIGAVPSDRVTENLISTQVDSSEEGNPDPELTGAEKGRGASLADSERN